MKKIGVVMDPMATIHPEKDTTLVLLLEAQARGYELVYFELEDLMIKNGHAYGLGKNLKVRNDAKNWFELSPSRLMLLKELDVIFMRKDPPFNLEYIYATYILEQAEREGALVLNKPQSLRDANEKIFATQFAQFCPTTLVTKNMALLHNFLDECQKVVFKPIDGMGGRSIFLVDQQDVNAQVVIETLTQWGTQTIMAQQFVPEIIHGDKRIILIDGEPVPYALNRIPAEKSIRGNLASGGKGVVVELLARDREICSALKETLIAKGLFFVGIDVIGDYLTEINVTSPTGIKQIEEQKGFSVAKVFFDKLAF